MSGNKVELKSVSQMLHMRRAALIVHDIHQALRQAAVPGVSLLELDAVSAEVIKNHGAQSNFLGYYGYPATVCISVNDTVVHGIPDEYRLREGDLVSFDCGCFVVEDGKQWHGDSCFSVIVGDDPGVEPADDERRVARQLNDLTYRSMVAAIAALDGAKHVGVVGDAVEDVCFEGLKEYGWEAGIVEEFIGHGIGTEMHQAPEVLNYPVSGRSAKLKPGMVLCVEPILTYGSAAVKTLPDGWTVKTKSGKLACHWECQVAIVADGISVLNQPDWGAAMLAPYGVTPVALA